MVEELTTKCDKGGNEASLLEWLEFRFHRSVSKLYSKIRFWANTTRWNFRSETQQNKYTMEIFEGSGAVEQKQGIEAEMEKHPVGSVRNLGHLSNRQREIPRRMKDKCWIITSAIKFN